MEISKSPPLADIVSALRCTDKGQLIYDRLCLSPENIQNISGARADISDHDPHLLHVVSLTSRNPVDITSEIPTSALTPSVKPRHRKSDSSVSYSRFAKLIHQQESQTSPLQEIFEKQLEEYKAFNKKLEQESEAQKIATYHRKYQIEPQHTDRWQELDHKQELLREKYRMQSKLLDERIHEAHRQNREEEQRLKLLKEQQQARHTELLQDLASLWAQVSDIQSSVEAAVRPVSCHLADHSVQPRQLLQQICQRLRTLVQQGQAGPDALRQGQAGPEALRQGQELLEQARKLMTLVYSYVDDAKKKMAAEEEERQRREQEEKKRQEQEQAVDTLLLTTDAVSQEVYQRLQHRLREVENSYQTLTQTPQLKKLRFDLQKAVNTTINAVSSVSGSHLTDKILRLRSILSGQVIDVGGKRISALSHPVGVNYCADMIAKKIVCQGEEQVSSSPASAHTFACVAVALWSEFPALGHLLLAHLYRRCPYLLPYCPPRHERQSQDDYYSALGYKLECGEVESQDSFLRRMSGYCRLYVAIATCSPPPTLSTRPHPHPAQYLWSLLARTLNQEPRPDITASVVYDTLEVGGWALAQFYHTQFTKLLRCIAREFIPRVVAVTPGGAGSGPVMRLQGLVDKALRNGGRIAPPPGRIQPEFWYS